METPPALVLERLLEPARLWWRHELLERPCPIPQKPGLYAWYLQGLPVPVGTCHFLGEYPLVYVGIAPSRSTSHTTLRSRIKQHLSRNASASTLRLTLGCLLREQLGIHLIQVGRRLHFGRGESVLNDWLDANARACWAEHATPWKAEADVIAALDLPLNLEHNSGHPFSPRLRTLRQAARSQARSRESKSGVVTRPDVAER